MNFNEVNKITIPEGSVGVIKNGGYIIWENNKYIPYYIENVTSEVATISYTMYGSKSHQLKYKIDDGVWIETVLESTSTTTTTTVEIATIQPNSRIYFIGDLKTDTISYTTSGSYINRESNRLVSDKDYSAGGNIMSVSAYQDDFYNLINIPVGDSANYGFQSWFGFGYTPKGGCCIDAHNVVMDFKNGGGNMGNIAFLFYKNEKIVKAPIIWYERQGINNDNLFYNCTSLKEATFMSETPIRIGLDSFKNCPADMIVYVPDESVELYRETSGWSKVASNIKGISEKPTE